MSSARPPFKFFEPRTEDETPTPEQLVVVTTTMMFGIGELFLCAETGRPLPWERLCRLAGVDPEEARYYFAPPKDSPYPPWPASDPPVVATLDMDYLRRTDFSEVLQGYYNRLLNIAEVVGTHVDVVVAAHEQLEALGNLDPAIQAGLDAHREWAKNAFIQGEPDHVDYH